MECKIVMPFQLFSLDEYILIGNYNSTVFFSAIKTLLYNKCINLRLICVHSEILCFIIMRIIFIISIQKIDINRIHGVYE